MLKNFEYLGTIGELQSNNYNWREVSNSKGVYVIVFNKLNMPQFVAKGTGGWFQERNPNVLIEELKNKWVNFNQTEERVLYIGRSSNLRRRTKQRMRFGTGQPVGAWGGRYIWQIGKVRELLVYIKKANNHEEEEKKLIQNFRDSHEGRLPFANLRG